MTMLSFHNDLKIKKIYVNRVKSHAKADEIIKGKYWQNGKGCAVGCTIHSSQHGVYETELGIPIVIAKLEDIIFERLPNEYAMKWPLEFLQAVPVGKDLSMVWPNFVLWLLSDPKNGVLQYSTVKTKPSIKKVIELYKRWINGDNPTSDEFLQARKAADADATAAAYAAAANAAAANAAAAYAAAAYAAAAAAADAAAYAAAANADAAAYAAAANADAAYAADAANAADVRNNFWINASKQLLKLLKEQ